MTMIDVKYAHYNSPYVNVGFSHRKATFISDDERWSSVNDAINSEDKEVKLFS